MLYDNWIHKLSESYTNSHNINESEMILEELNETKEYVNILEGVLNALLENDIITEEIILEVASGADRKLLGFSDEDAERRDRRINSVISGSQAQIRDMDDLGTIPRGKSNPLTRAQRKVSDAIMTKNANRIFDMKKSLKGSTFSKAYHGVLAPEVADKLDSRVKELATIGKTVRATSKRRESDKIKRLQRALRSEVRKKLKKQG
jgi:hypothetical protein